MHFIHDVLLFHRDVDKYISMLVNVRAYNRFCLFKTAAY